LKPRFSFLSRHHLRLTTMEMVIHGDPGLLALSAGIVCVLRNSAVTCNQSSYFKEIMPTVDVVCSKESNEKQCTYKQAFKALTRKA
ncbi:hypothetical protein XENOCAPTIV_000198, partial [Xenoophorus captivus]